jgi:chemotaxis protein MotB
MAATHDQLVNELRDELESGQIQIKRLVDGISLDVSDELLFSSGEARLNEAGKALLARVAGQISGDDSVLSVEGHTDDVRVGAALRDRYPTNWELAGARAAIVVRTLSEAGVDPIRMRAVSRGPFAPIASNETAEGRARNRRTEIILRPLPK